MTKRVEAICRVRRNLEGGEQNCFHVRKAREEKERLVQAKGLAEKPLVFSLSHVVHMPTD